MSFCNANRNSTPGFINGNALRGMCEKICVHAKKVLDACLRLRPRENQAITLTDISPAAPIPVAPLVFVGCAPQNSSGIISNLTVTRIPDSNRRVRVTCDVAIPTTVIFTDATGATFQGSGVINNQMDVVMCRPENSLIGYEADSTVNISCFGGSWTGNGYDFVIDCCTVILLRLVVDCDLLVPCYGYCPINPCREFENEPCEEFFRRPLYPPARI